MGAIFLRRPLRICIPLESAFPLYKLLKFAPSWGANLAMKREGMFEIESFQLDERFDSLFLIYGVSTYV